MRNKRYVKPKDKERITKETTKTIQESTLMDDIFFRICAEDQKEVVRLIIAEILQRPELEIEDYHVQHHIDNYSGRSIIVDAFARDTKTGATLNVEVQKSTDNNIPQRARYHSAILDTQRGLKKGQTFDKLNQSVVIFLCSDDILEKGKILYRITRKTDDNEPFNDGSQILILNCSYKDESITDEQTERIMNLIKDLNQPDPNKMHYKALAEAVREKKERIREEEAMNIFDKAYEDGRIDGIEEGIEKGIIEGSKQTSIETAKKLLALGKLSIDDIAESTSLPIETIKELAG